MNAVSAEVVPAGEYLAKELDERAWTQAEFAEILGRPAQFVSEIISGKKEITRESAAQIGAALGTPPEMWLNLQDSYLLKTQLQNKKTQSELHDVRLRARLMELAPVSVLRKRGIVTEASPQGQAEQLLKLFRLKSINDTPQLPVIAHPAKRDESVSPAQMTWLACVRQRAEDMKASAFTLDGLRELAETLSRKVNSPPSFAQLPKMFAAVGVRLTFVEDFPYSKVDGASFVLQGSPVIGISGRGQRLDKVLFSLLHEVAHVTLGHVDDYLIIDVEGRRGAAEEESANDLAARWILPQVPSHMPERVTERWVAAVARDQGVHPIVVVGRLQDLGLLSWRSTLTKGAPSVTEFLQSW
ncbi:helix-turn-helix domain-containing protein [Pseudarthrobacter sp. alpha12b]